MRILVIIALVLLPGLTSRSDFANQDSSATSEQALPICKVLAEASRYDGKLITVSAFYRAVIHGSVLYGPDCSKTYVNVREAADYKADRHALKTIRAVMKKDWSQPVDVVVQGTFRVAKTYHCFGQNCLQYEIEEHELLRASPVKRENSSEGADSRNSSHPKPMTH
jgi:hypothetical protein